MTTDVSTLKKQIAALLAALNDKSARALGALFTEDAEFVDILGTRMRGRPDIEAQHEGHFKLGVLAGSAFESKKVEVTLLGADVARCILEWRRLRLPDADDRTLPPGDGVFTLVAARGEGGWLFAAAHNTQVAAPPMR